MRILLIGSGGREHALGRKLKLDDPGLDLHAAPGNPGLATLGTCHRVAANQVDALMDLAVQLGPDLVLIGPEEPLTLGLSDQLRAKGFTVFGPSQAAAQLEASKAFAKDVMDCADVPTGRYAVFATAAEARAALKTWPEKLVVKADGLAAGKGVVVCASHTEALQAIEALSHLGQPLLIEEMLEGPEISLFALVQGSTVVPLTTAQDHKRVGAGDTGPNTGGMGAYSPGILPAGLTMADLIDLSVRPIAEEMVRRGQPYQGVLFVGLMLTADGPKVLEYNVRFGDPECQVLMARLQSPLAPLLLGQAEMVQWHDQAAMTIVLAAQGYPDAYEKGHPISLPETLPPDAHLIHAGTATRDGALVTAGGRVMNAVGQGMNLQAARQAAYDLAQSVEWQGRFYRPDIGWRALGT